MTRPGLGQWLQGWREVNSFATSEGVEWMGHDWMWRVR